jgi:hypothetical protein
MCAAFVAYIVLHTPLRNEIAGLIDIGNRSCYLCAHSLTGRDIADSIAAATLLLLAVAGGWMLAIRCAFPSYEKVLVFGVATIGLVTVPAAAIAGLASLLNGTYLRAPVGPLLAAIPAGIVVAAAVRDGRKFRMGLTTEGFPTPLLLFAAAAAGAMFVAATALSLGHPPTQGDALSYHAPLGVLFWSDGNLTAPLDRAPVFFALANPGTAELWNGLLRLIGGERLADLGQLPFALLGSSAVYAFTRRTGLLGGSALLAACAFLLMPIVALQMGTQADDVAGAALVMTAIALASAPTDQWDDKRLATLGLALGLAATTKLALLPSVAAVAVFMLGAGIRDHGRARRRIGAVAVASFVVMFVVAVAPWWARNIAREGNPVFPQGLPLVGHGFNIGGFGRIDTEFVPRPAAWPLYPLVEPIDDRSGFGVLFALGLIPGLVLAVRRARRQPLLLYFLGILITLPVWWGYTDPMPASDSRSFHGPFSPCLEVRGGSRSRFSSARRSSPSLSQSTRGSCRSGDNRSSGRRSTIAFGVSTRRQSPYRRWRAFSPTPASGSRGSITRATTPCSGRRTNGLSCSSTRARSDARPR